MNQLVSMALHWLAFVAVLALLLGTVLAWRTERREGLSTSSKRALVLAALTLVALGLALHQSSLLPLPFGAPLMPVAAVPTPKAVEAPPGPSATVDQDVLNQELAALLRERDELDHRIAEKRALMTNARRAPTDERPPPPSAEQEKQASAPSASPWGLVVLLLALLAVVGLGRGDTLPLLGRWRRAAATTATASRSKGIAAALRGDHAKAGELLGTIPESGLEVREQLDLLFARASSAMQLAGETGTQRPREERNSALAHAERDIRRLLEIAPRMAEGHYLLGMVLGLKGEHAGALQAFRSARQLLADGGDAFESLPLAQNESACCLALAEQALQIDDRQQADAHFAEVRRLGVLADEASLMLFSHSLGKARKALREGKLDAAQSAMKETRATAGLPEALRARALAACDVYDLVLKARAGDQTTAAPAIRDFLGSRLPSDLPAADEQVADEALFRFESKQPLALPANAFRTLFFWLAVAEARALSALGRAPNEASAAPMIEALLRALQFEPRQRDALAGLGAISYWFIPGKREQGLGWVRSAAMLGVHSRVLARLLERERLFQAERREALDHFLDASARFLVDPTLTARVRADLASELGRFEPFRPLLLELGTLPTASVPPTLDSLRERSRYLADLLERCGSGKGPLAAERLRAVDGAYRDAVKALEGNVTSLAALEQQVVVELGKALLS